MEEKIIFWNFKDQKKWEIGGKSYLGQGLDKKRKIF
jgi:hypothetical protein